MEMIKGRFKILRELGRGGLGVVYECRDEADNHFAVKIPAEGSVDAARMLEDEARRLYRWQGTYVVKHYGPIALDDGQHGFAMELMERHLGQRGRLLPALLLPVLRSVLTAVNAIHASAPGAFHGDLKRANILLKGSAVKLADFGLARGGVGQTAMAGPHDGGTPGYFPPEGFSSPRGDIYSIGVVAHAALLDREPVPGAILGISIPGHPKLEGVINAMLNRNPSHRPSARTVLDQFDELEREAGERARAARQDDSRAGWGLLAIVAAVVGVVLLVRSK